MKLYLIIVVFIIFQTVKTNSQSSFQKIFNSPIVTINGFSVNSAWGDYDNDGYQDLAITQYSDACPSCTYPILLFHNNGDGTFSQVTNNAISQENLNSIGIAWGDYDNDGLLDLFVGTRLSGNNVLFHNDGNGNFTKITNSVITSEGGHTTSCSWIDYDRDGWLDLFVANSDVNCYLYHNNGNGTFTKITNGPIVNDLNPCRGSSWGDFDNDGWSDLFVVTYQGSNDLLYHNNGNGTFTKITNGPVVNDGMWGTQCCWGDYDNDGYLDLFVTNQNGPNRLYHNEGNGTFSISTVLPSQPPGGFLGACWGDYDNDGFIDLHMGKVPGTSVLYKNNLGTSFSYNSSEPMNNESCYDGNWGDFTNNGRLNLFVSYSPNNSLYQNVGTVGNYLICKLHGCQSNKFGIGARIIVKAGNLREIREVNDGNGNGFMLPQHFGLGNNNMIDSLIVLWPYGNTERKQVLRNISVNQTITVDECAIGIQPISSEIPREFLLYQNYPNPFNPSTKIKFDLPGSSVAQTFLSVYNILGKEIAVLINQPMQPGSYEVEWNASNYPSGVYFYKLTSGSFTDKKKFILLK